MWNAVIFRRVPTRGEVKWLHHDVYQRSRDSGSNLWDQLGPAMADRSPPCWVGLDSAYWGVPFMGDARRQPSNTVFADSCVFMFSSVCFLLVRFDAYHDFPATLTCFELLAIFNSSLHIHGGPTHLAPASAQILTSCRWRLLQEWEKNLVGWIHVKLKVECLFRAAACLCGHWY